ncbi:MAG: J domain-containing protein [Actinomycetota bacterium]
MLNNAFTVLGIEPTTDGRIIRNAYVRLARIYHPDRFIGMPNDVRLEAERRMKETAAAYASLRAAKKAAAESAPPARRGKKDPWEEAKRVRETVAARQLELERSRRRWLVWEELERQARERAAYEASLVVLGDDATITVERSEIVASEEPKQSQLSRRLETARGGRGDKLAPRT